MEEICRTRHQHCNDLIRLFPLWWLGAYRGGYADSQPSGKSDNQVHMDPFPQVIALSPQKNLCTIYPDSSGINFNYEIGAEEVIAGFKLLVIVVKAYAGHTGDLTTESDPVRL